MNNQMIYQYSASSVSSQLSTPGVPSFAVNKLDEGLGDIGDSCMPLAQVSPSIQSSTEGHGLLFESTLFSPDDNLSILDIPEITTSMVRSLEYPLPHMNDEDKMLFDFCRLIRASLLTLYNANLNTDASKMCPKCMVRNGNNNNYRQVVLPLVYQSQLLLKTVLAVAANRLKLHQSSFQTNFQTVALRYQSLALKGLQQSITSKRRTWFSRIEILSIILMLCFFEIYDPSPGSTDQSGVPVRPWQAHSWGIRHLLEESTIDKSQDFHYERAILSFHSQNLASRSILTYTAMSPNDDQEGILQSALHWLDMADRPSSEINPFAGCSNELLGLILSITCQLRRRQLLAEPLSDYCQVEWVEKTRQQLLGIEQYSPMNTPSTLFHELSGHGLGHGDNSTCSEGSIVQAAESFRLAALILLENMTPDDDDQSERRKAYYLSQLFQNLEAGINLPPSGKLGSSSYFWPYFIAGCHLKYPQQQAAMLGLLSRLASSSDDADRWQGQTIVQQTQDVLVRVWKLMNDNDMTTALISDEKGGARFVWEDASVLGSCVPVFDWV
jgi:hypothetical protein